MELTIHTDGGSRGNPGPSAIGVVIASPTTSLAQFGLYIGMGTNNAAEYKAVIAALQWVSRHAPHASRLSFFLDSQLVVSQLSGVFAVKHPDMKRLKDEVDTLLHSLACPATFSYVPRARNAEADRLVNAALDAHATFPSGS